MRRKILSMVTVVMMLFMAVGCGGGGTATADNSSNKETQLSVTFKQSANENFQKAERSDVKSVRLSISKGSTFYLEAAAMTKDAVTNKWGIGINLDNSLAPFDVVAIARDSVDDSGNILFRTKVGSTIDNFTTNMSVVLEEVVEDISTVVNLPSVKRITHSTSGNTVNLHFVINNAVSYELSSKTGGTFSTPIGTLSTTDEAELDVVYTKVTFEVFTNLSIKLINADGDSRVTPFLLTEDVLTVNFPPVVKVNVEEKFIPTNSYKITATVIDEDSTSWNYLWGARGGKALLSDTLSPNEFEMEALNSGEGHPLCFRLRVTDEIGASTKLDYCIKNSNNGYVGLKKTGQTKSYAQDGTVEVTRGVVKDDGFYQKGLTPQYTRNDTSQTVTDHVTGLIWQDDENVSTSKYTWTEAKGYCESKGKGWYLPSIEELGSIIDYSTR